jgi:hypothetical protein
MPLTGFPDFSAHDDPLVQEYAPIIGQRLKIHHGPIKSWMLEDQFHLKGVQVRAIIHALRMAQCPICSSQKGYWWGTPDEVKKTIEHLRERVRSISAVAWALEQSLVETADLPLFRAWASSVPEVPVANEDGHD